MGTFPGLARVLSMSYRLDDVPVLSDNLIITEICHQPEILLLGRIFILGEEPGVAFSPDSQ